MGYTAKRFDSSGRMLTEESRVNTAVCFTGHRELPDRLSAEYRGLVMAAWEALQRVYANGVRDFYTGGAAGFDQLAGELVLRLKSRDPSVSLHILLPYAGYTGKQTVESLRARKALLSAADEVTALFPSYFRSCFILRDRELVERTEGCIAYLRKVPSGTAWTVSFAKKKGMDVILL